MNRYLIVEMSGICGDDGKYSDVVLYQTDDEAEADDFSDRLNKEFEDRVEITGGYPDRAWVLDTQDPKSFGDIGEKLKELREWDEEFRDEEAEA